MKSIKLHPNYILCMAIHRYTNRIIKQLQHEHRFTNRIIKQLQHEHQYTNRIIKQSQPEQHNSNSINAQINWIQLNPRPAIRPYINHRVHQIYQHLHQDILLVFLLDKLEDLDFLQQNMTLYQCHHLLMLDEHLL